MTIKLRSQGEDEYKDLFKILQSKNIKHIEAEKYEDFIIPGTVPIATFSWGNNLKTEIETKNGQIYYIEATGPFFIYSKKLPPEQKRAIQKAIEGIKKYFSQLEPSFEVKINPDGSFSFKATLNKKL